MIAVFPVLLVIIDDSMRNSARHASIKAGDWGPLTTLAQNSPLSDSPMPARTKQMLLQLSHGSAPTGENRLTLRYFSPNFLVVVSSRRKPN